MKKSLLTHSVAAPSQIKPASLGFDLVFLFERSKSYNYTPTDFIEKTACLGGFPASILLFVRAQQNSPIEPSRKHQSEFKRKSHYRNLSNPIYWTVTNNPVERIHMKGIQSNGFLPIIAQAIADMEAQYREFSSIDEINLAELGRRTGLSRAKLRRLKANGFRETAHGLVGTKKEHILDGYSAVLDRLLRNGVSNSAVCLERLQETGFNRKLQHSETVYRRPQASHTGQAATGVASGKPRAPLHHSAWRGLPDGLGLHRCAGL